MRLVETIMFASSAVRDADVGRRAPGFTAEENDIIAAWSEPIRHHGLRVEIDAGRYEFLGEALLVLPCAGDEPCWVVHKTPGGAVAVRLWPGLAHIVATLPEALAMIMGAAEQPGAAGAVPVMRTMYN